MCAKAHSTGNWSECNRIFTVQERRLKPELQQSNARYKHALLSSPRRNPAQATYGLPSAGRQPLQRAPDGEPGIFRPGITPLSSPAADRRRQIAPAAESRVGGRSRRDAPDAALSHARAAKVREH